MCMYKRKTQHARILMFSFFVFNRGSFLQSGQNHLLRTSWCCTELQAIEVEPNVRTRRIVTGCHFATFWPSAIAVEFICWCRSIRCWTSNCSCCRYCWARKPLPNEFRQNCVLEEQLSLLNARKLQFFIGVDSFNMNVFTCPYHKHSSCAN